MSEGNSGLFEERLYTLCMVDKKDPQQCKKKLVPENHFNAEHSEL